MQQLNRATRWATHGIPNEARAHPHFDAKRRFSIVHNGIIENYPQLKTEFVNEGFVSFSNDVRLSFI